MEDRQIIGLFDRREETAITATADKYGGFCFRIAENILGDRREAEECVNDTWFRVWEKIPPAHPDSLKAFLGRITRNLALDRYREQHREKRGGGVAPVALEELDGMLSGGESVDAELIGRQLSESVNAFLGTLPARERAVFLRRYFYFDSVRSIAEATGLKENHIPVLLARIRKKLREHLEREGYLS